MGILSTFRGINLNQQHFLVFIAIDLNLINDQALVLTNF